MDLSIIVVSYNSCHYLPGLLTSIKNSKDKLNKEVIIVDNASSDDSVKVAKGRLLKPTVIASKSNQGFSKGVNQGIGESTGEYILLLNPDTRVVGDCLSLLHEFAQKTFPLGAVAPRLFDLDGRPQASVFHSPTILNAIKKNFLSCKTCFGKYLPDNRIQKVDVAVMAAFLIPRETINQVGGLNEKYFLYYEDFDFCRKLKTNKLPICYFPKAKVKHAHGASGNFKEHLQSPLLQSAETYFGKRYSKLLNLTLWIGHKWQVILRRKRFRD